jgi:ATP-binding cassette, subfamily B, bacterial
MEMKQVLQFFWHSIKNYRLLYLLMLMAPVVEAFYEPIAYYSIKIMVDIIASSKNLTFHQLLVPLSIFGISYIITSALWRLSEIALWNSEPYVQQGIILRSLQKILSFRYTFFQNTANGSLVSKIKSLLDGYTELWAQLYYGTFYWLIASIIASCSMLFVNYRLGIVIILWSIVYLTVNYFFAKKINLLSQHQNNSKHTIMGEISDNITNIQSIKLFSSQKHEIDRLNKKIGEDFVPKEILLYKFHLKVDVCNDILGMLIIFSMLAIMIQLKLSNKVSVGDFVFVFGMLFQLQENLWHLMQEFHKLSDRMGDLRSSLSIYEKGIIEDENTQIENNKTNVTLNNNSHKNITDYPSYKEDHKFVPNIDFRNINFAYNDNNQILSNLSLSIKAGEKVGIIGHTGCGKTTLVNLLLKVFIPQSGKILLGNQNIATQNCDFIRNSISVIPQNTILFNRSILDNIGYSRPDATKLEIIEAAKKAYADEFIQKLPEGYSTCVGEGGIRLSGGQRQQIAIARAILKDAPILILDEATSALDSTIEHSIHDILKILLKNKTVIAIAHRFATLKSMDKLIVIDRGKIVETGTHDKLINNPQSLYYKLWHTQYT